MKKLALVLIALIMAAAGVGYAGSRRLGTPFRGYEAESQLVEVPSGANSRSLGDRLVGAGILRDALP